MEGIINKTECYKTDSIDSSKLIDSSGESLSYEDSQLQMSTTIKMELDQSGGTSREIDCVDNAEANHGGTSQLFETPQESSFEEKPLIKMEGDQVSDIDDEPDATNGDSQLQMSTTIKIELDQSSVISREVDCVDNAEANPGGTSQLVQIPQESSFEEKILIPIEGDQVSDINDEPDATPQQIQSRFKVDVNQIESVTVEDQDADIQSLGLTVYNQSTLERGIWDQVERETKKRKAQQELINVASKLKLAEEQLKRVEATKGVKRSILQSALEEPARKKMSNAAMKDHQLKTKEKVEELRLKKAKLQAQLSNKALIENNEMGEESERDRKIRMGEMTPFGTTANATSSNLSSFEKYLQSQQELHKKMMSSTTVKRKSSSKSSKGHCSDKHSEPSIRHKTSSSKNILKKNILFPKKSKAKEKLGTDISEEHEGRPAGNLPGETAVVDLEESGSEYVPSATDDDGDFELESPEKKRPNSHVSKKEKPSTSKGSMSDRWAGGSLKRRKKPAKVLPDGDAEDWNSDDSDWICTDDEEFDSDHGTGKSAKRSSRRAKDDGNSEDFFRRVKLWERQNDGLRDQLEADVHEFDNGFKVPNSIWDKLYVYQQVGVRWMWELNQQKCGGILGDEMGLGKTIQIISFLAGLFISKLKCRTTGYRGLGPTLIVCPTTVMHQWVREFHTWFPPLRVAILHESGSYDGNRSQLIRDMLHEKGVMITSYTAVVRLQKHLLHQRWHYVILDEGHKIRNPDAQVTLALKQMRTPHRIILSGSPLQNNLRELWSLMDFVFPGKLGTLPVFMSEFSVPISQGGYSNASEVMVATAFKCATVLRDTIAPYLLRRMKADVSDHIKLPSKNEQVLFCRLTDEQRDLYKEYLQCGEVGRILEGRCQIFVGLINLRKICNHPHLFSGGPKLFSHEKEENLPLDERFGYWEKAGKMVVIEALLKMWHKQEHRVLIFTQSRQMLLIMEKFVSDKGYKYLKLDGGTSIAARQPMITKFNGDKSFFVMLLTTRVGGLGVNLTGANRVVIYDPDWNPATDTQARERAWRIGQQNAVTVYRLITAGTIEEKMYHRQIFKQFLCNKVLKDPRQRRFFQSSDLLDLFTLKETDDSTTETSAIFAGTNSQVHVKPKSDSKRGGRDKKAFQSSSHHYRDSSLHVHQSKSKHEKPKSHSDTRTGNKSSKLEQTAKISFSQDKLEHMKKLAHELSLKLSNKVSAISKESSSVDMEKESHQVRNSANVNNNEKTNEADKVVAGEVDEADKAKSKLERYSNGKDASEDAAVQRSLESDKESEGPQMEGALPSVDLFDEAILADDSDDDLKQVALELSKELMKKVKTAAALNTPKIGEGDSVGKLKSQSVGNQVVKDSIENFVSVDMTTSDDSCRKSLEISEMNNELTNKTVSPERSTASSQSADAFANLPNSYSKSKVHNESRHKKSKKHKKKKHKDAVFEGERVRGLVKASPLEEKTKEEIQEQASHNAKQDDYVLRKLFAKTGIKTAMQHDRVMQSGDADYALVEGEARRVAQEAVKAMKASRQHCWNPMSGQATWTGSSGAIRVPQGGQNKPQQSRPKFGKKKTLLKKSSTQTSNEAEAEEEAGSSSLLARIRARNLLLNDDDDDNNPAGAPPSVANSNKELLDDIRTFVSFGASVDGRATTEEIITQFRDRLPPQSSALFKQMLMQICEFHRLPSGQGVWKLIPDFKW